MSVDQALGDGIGRVLPVQEAALFKTAFRPSGPILATALAMGLLAAPGLPGPAHAQGIAGAYLSAEQAARRGDLSEAADRYAAVLARDPNNVTLMERAMLHQIAAGKMVQAMALARRLEQLSPGRHLALLLLASDAVRRDDFAKVQEIFPIDDEPDGPFVGALINAWAAYGKGDVATAHAVLDQVEAENLGGPAGQLVAAYHQGLIAAASGDDEKAADAFARAADRASASGERMTRFRAGALARLGQLDEARAVLDERLARSFSDRRIEQLARDLEAGKLPAPEIATTAQGIAEALFGLASFLTQGPNNMIGLAYARLASNLAPELVAAHLLIGSELHQSGQYELAIEAYEAVPDDADESLDAHIGRADALEAAGQVDEAVEELRGIVARWPQNIGTHTALGDVLRRNERFEESAAAYDGAVSLVGALENRHWPLLYQRGIAYERSKQWALAEADFLKALELEPDQPQVLNYLGYSWVEMGLHLDKAEEMIAKAVEQRPDDGYIVDSLGWVLYRMGDFDEAVQHLERAVELRPVDPVINDHFGDALWMVGRRIEAEFQWRRALSFEPEEKDAKRIKRKLAQGLDEVLAEEEAAGTPAIIGRSEDTETEENDGG